MKRQGFTLVELLVTIVITATLAAVGGVGVASLKKRAALATETNAAHQLIIGYLNYAADHQNKVMPGYQSDPDVTNLDGEPLHDPVNARYPWRIAPYVPSVEGIMLYNGNERFLKDPQRDYLVSVQPNLGLNTVFMGGHFGSGSPLRPSPRLIEAIGPYYVSRMSQAVRPELQLVFASARSSTGASGHFEVRPPRLLAPNWKSSDFSEDSLPSDHGFVDFRWSGRAVTAMLGGNVELLDESELRDMRRWSHQAARLNNPDYTVGK
ncbi:MAG: type II secretion system GspH family protein [Akkermansiaceae bacterium]|jgi:prepilin-type N-terminal cleavage/methylation domain-containing protein|nr:type II secretion system GspH family protein [Akkermansiaceae bacterium]